MQKTIRRNCYANPDESRPKWWGQVQETGEMSIRLYSILNAVNKLESKSKPIRLEK